MPNYWMLLVLSLTTDLTARLSTIIDFEKAFLQKLITKTRKGRKYYL